MTEKEQFKYGEEVLVRNDEMEDWSKRVYVGTLPNCDRHWAMSILQHHGNFDGLPWPWRQIRKIQKDKTKSPETSPTKKEESQLRDDANWAIEQALAIGHREYGEVVRAAKLIIESQKELIKFMKEGWTD